MRVCICDCYYCTCIITIIHVAIADCITLLKLHVFQLCTYTFIYTRVCGQLKRIRLYSLPRSSQFKQDVLFTAIKGGMKLLSFGLEGASVLYDDIVKACSHILDSRITEVSHVTGGHVGRQVVLIYINHGNDN